MVCHISYSTLYTLYSTYCTVYTLWYTLYSAQCTPQSAYCLPSSPTLPRTLTLTLTLAMSGTASMPASGKPDCAGRSINPGISSCEEKLPAHQLGDIYLSRGRAPQAVRSLLLVNNRRPGQLVRRPTSQRPKSPNRPKEAPADVKKSRLDLTDLPASCRFG